MKKTVCIIGIILALGLAVLCWVLLPETVPVQFGLDGHVSRTMPKIPAIAVPFLISAAGGVICLKGDPAEAKKGAAVLATGILAMAVMLVLGR